MREKGAEASGLDLCKVSLRSQRDRHSPGLLVSDIGDVGLPRLQQA